MKKGLFIVFEGIDGSGKSSCMEDVASALEKNFDVVRTAEPTKGGIGMLLRSSTDLLPVTEALLFVADRAEHTGQITKWVDDGKVVLCDRYYASTLAYQSVEMDGHLLDGRWLKALNDKVTVEPDITFLFDIDPEISMERIGTRGTMSKFERLEYLKGVRKRYLSIARSRKFTVIDASGPKEAVFKEIMRHILDAI